MTKKINVKLLRRIQKYVLADPKRVDMNTFISYEGEPETYHSFRSYPDCGTVGCIAGGAVTLSQKKRVKYGSVEKKARRLLGLDSEQAKRLFYDRLYDSPGMVTAKPQTKLHARQTAKLIDRFIETEGAK
jgi:hypothetical protein